MRQNPTYYVSAIVLLYIMLNEATNINFSHNQNPKLDRSNTQQQDIQVQLIKKSYQSAIKYYNQGNVKLAEKEFIKVLKPILSKGEIRELDQNNIPYIKTELLDAIYHLGLIYHNDKTYPNNYPKAAAIYQYCAKFANKYKVKNIDSKFFINEAHKLEKQFLQSIGVSNTANIYSNSPAKYQNELKAFRHQIKQKLDDLDHTANLSISLRAKQVEIIYHENAKFFMGDDKKGLLQKLLADCNRQLGGPPEGLQYAIIALGSFASGTATPWSDLEFAILISQNDEKYKQYFRNLAKLFYIKIINLGETQLRWVGIESLNNFKTAKEEDDWFWDNIMPYGVSLDGAHWHACETPLGRKGYKAKVKIESRGEVIIDKPDFELILTPHEMIKFQQEQVMTSNGQNWAETDPHLVQSLRSVSLIDGSQDLVDGYRSNMKDAVSLDIVRKRTIKILQEDVKNFQLKLGAAEEGKLIDVKKDIYRLVDRIINGLANYYNIIAPNEQKSITVWNMLDHMRNMGVLSSLGAEHFKEALSVAAELRLRTYLNNLDNANKELMVVYIPYTDIIRHFYQVMLRVQELIKEFCNLKHHQQAEQILKSDSLYIDDDYMIALINTRLRTTPTQ